MEDDNALTKQQARFRAIATIVIVDAVLVWGFMVCRFAISGWHYLVFAWNCHVGNWLFARLLAIWEVSI